MKHYAWLGLMVLIFSLVACSDSLDEDTIHKIVLEIKEKMKQTDMTTENALEEIETVVLTENDISKQIWDDYLKEHPEIALNLSNAALDAAFSSLNEMSVPGDNLPANDEEESGPFSGEYYSDWGPIILTQTGKTVRGEYQNENDQSTGTIRGEVIEEGNRMEFEWSETLVKEDGTIQRASGIGYFILSENQEYINGEWKLEGSEDWDGTWSAQRQ